MLWEHRALKRPGWRITCGAITAELLFLKLRNVNKRLPGPVQFLNSIVSSREQEEGIDRALAFFSSLGLPPVSPVHKLQSQVSDDFCSAAGSCRIPAPAGSPLKGIATAENKRNAAAQVTFLSSLLQNTPLPERKAMVPSGSATPFSKSQNHSNQGWGKTRSVNAEQTVGALETETLDLESHLCQWEMG